MLAVLFELPVRALFAHPQEKVSPFVEERKIAHLTPASTPPVFFVCATQEGGGAEAKKCLLPILPPCYFFPRSPFPVPNLPRLIVILVAPFFSTLGGCFWVVVAGAFGRRGGAAHSASFTLGGERGRASWLVDAPKSPSSGRMGVGSAAAHSPSPPTSPLPVRPCASFLPSSLLALSSSAPIWRRRPGRKRQRYQERREKSVS